MPVDDKTSATAPDLPDKNFLYGRYEAGRERIASADALRKSWRDRLYRKLAHKSLDIAEDIDAEDMQLNVDNSRTRTGAGVLEFAGVAVAVIAAAGGGYLLALPSSPVEPVPPVAASGPAAAPPASVGTDTRNTLRFVD